MKIAILGGTFNPIHIGHLLLAEEILFQENFERVLLVPSKNPAHKIVSGASNQQRIKMLRLATKNLPVHIETCELLREGISYCIDTVHYIYKKYKPSEKPTLVMGDDLFQDFASWKDAQELSLLVNFFIAHRVSIEKVDSPFHCRYLKNKILPLSSSEIRQRIADHKAWRALVPQTVADYIEKNKLYLKGPDDEK